MLKIAICDDMAQDGERLRSALAEGLRCREMEAEMTLYPCGEALLGDVQEGRFVYDLIFLDIYMTGLTGMDAARRLRDLGQTASLIFLTSSPDFAVEGYEVAASGYLLKPLDVSRLEALLDRLLAPAPRPRLALKCGGGYRYFDYGEICYIESLNHTLLLHTADGGCTRVTGKLGEVEEQLDDPRFLRCHQSYLVNMEHIYKAGDDFLLQNGAIVPIRVRSRRVMTDTYYSFFVTRTAGKEAGCV